MKVAALIPAYNEEKYIQPLLLRTEPFVDYVIVVDDGSKDKTWEQCRNLSSKIIALRHPINLGKGAALKTGCEAAKRFGIDIIVTLDGDGQHEPNQIPGVLEYMKKNKYDIVFSVRKNGHTMPMVRKMGNVTLNFLARHLFHINLRDIWCGFRVFRTDILPKIDWTRTDYSGEIQMALKVGRSGLQYGEYIIPTIYHDAHKGVTIFHGLKLILQMFIWRFTLLK